MRRFVTEAGRIVEDVDILIVDDVPSNLYVLQKALEISGLNSKVASSAMLALEELKKKKPDLILLDILMPAMNGLELCEILQKDDETKDIPVIFLTAKTDPDDLIKAFNSGGRDYITKPFNVSEVIARVKTHIELKKAREENERYIRELKEANERLSKAERELSEINTSKDKFFSIIAHDLKNPFQGFLGLTQLLMNDLDDFSRKDLREVVAGMHKSADKLHTLLDNLLTWSRIQMDKMDFIPLQNNLYELVNRSLAVFKDNANLKNIELSNRVPENQAIVVDRLMIDTVLRNLISNAIKFTKSGGKIVVYSELNCKNIDVIVSDNGIGISDYDMKQLFKIESTFSKQGTSNETGTGLGLILCKELVEKNGGSLNFSSQVGIGTTFRIKLPYMD